MPDMMKDFEHLKSFETTALMDRRSTLISSGPPAQLPDETLQELLAIARILRTRTVAPKAPGTGGKKIAPTLDAL